MAKYFLHFYNRHRCCCNLAFQSLLRVDPTASSAFSAVRALLIKNWDPRFLFEGQGSEWTDICCSSDVAVWTASTTALTMVSIHNRLRCEGSLASRLDQPALMAIFTASTSPVLGNGIIPWHQRQSRPYSAISSILSPLKTIIWEIGTGHRFSHLFLLKRYSDWWSFNLGIRYGRRQRSTPSSIAFWMEGVHDFF